MPQHIESYIELQPGTRVMQKRFLDISRILNTLPLFSDAETPVMVSALVYELANAPNPPLSLVLFEAGVGLLVSPTNYTLVGNMITLVVVPTGALTAWYRY